MSVRVTIPSLLRQHVGGESIVDAAGGSVGECLADLAARFPELGPKLYDENGGIARYVHLFVNGEQASAARTVKDGDELLIMLAVSGG